MLLAKSNKEVLLTKNNKNDRNQQINNNNNLITLIIMHQYQQKDTLIKPSPSQTVLAMILVKEDHSLTYIQSIHLPVYVLVIEHIQLTAVVDN